MTEIVSIHSFRGGTGKSNTTANVATILAAQGRRVGVVDCDIQSPGIHVLFGLDQQRIDRSLNNYLWGDCSITEAAYDVTPNLDVNIEGRIWFMPASMNPSDIARVMREGYDAGLLNEGFRSMARELSLEVLILDTHPGLNEETLLSIAMSNALAIVLRPDQQDYEGTRVTMAVARKLRVPRIVLVVNKTPPTFDLSEVKTRVEKTYDCEVAAVLPHSDELMVLSSSGIFVLRYPHHAVTELYRKIAAVLI